VTGEPFVPATFEVPRSLEGPGFRLEPLGPEHNERDHEAWMSSIDHIRSTPGADKWDGEWPLPMSLEQNLDDLVMHAEDFESRSGFTYSILDGDEVIGCVYIYPSKRPGHDAEVTSWVRASRAEMDAPVWRRLSEWIERDWPFDNPSYAERT
jgi:hypothetical protein